MIQRRFQYSIRGLLLFALLSGLGALPFSYFLYKKRQERSAVVMLRELGAIVIYDWQLAPEHRPPGPGFVYRWLDEESFGEVATISFAYGGGLEINDTSILRLRPLKGVESLMLRYANLSDAGLAHLCEFRRLISLDLSYTHNIRGPGLKELGCLSSLQRLSLASTRIDDESLSYLTTCRSLEQLDLSRNKIYGHGLVSLGELPRLAELDLSSTEVTAEGLKSLSALRHIRILWLDGTSVDDDALREVAEAKTLRVLTISSDNVTDMGVQYLTALPKLQQLSLQGERITDDGIASLAGLRSLRYLQLDGFTKQTKQRLKAQLPNCKIRWLPRSTERDLWELQREEILSEKD